MKRRHLPELAPETRAEIARRRLEQLALSFSGGETPPPVIDDFEDDDDPDEGAVARPPRHVSMPQRAPRPSLSPTHLRIAAAAAVALGIVLTWWLLAERPRSAEVGNPVTLSSAGGKSSTGASPSVTSSAAPTQVVVDVAGEVRRPGIVTLPVGSRVHQAIAKAGGLKRGVDTTSLNLARVLVDGEQVLVGVEAPAASAAGGAAAPLAPGAAVNLNTATLEQLDALPGVGPVTAQHILDWRTEHGSFTAVDDLLDVPGIGDKTLADLRDLVTV